MMSLLLLVANSRRLLVVALMGGMVLVDLVLVRESRSLVAPLSFLLYRRLIRD